MTSLTRKQTHNSCRIVLVAAVLVALTAISSADECSLSLLPSESTLNYKGASHRLILEQQIEGKWRADLSSKSKFVSSNPNIATVDEQGVVRAVSDGEVTITAESEAGKSEAKVKVEGTGAKFNWSFPLHIQPVLFKAGCNTGACHGAAAGKNGFKLSLRGYDHENDHNQLTRQASGRRVSLAEPEQSLILQKGTMEVAHGGGERFAKNSDEYNRVLAWVQAGAPGRSAEEAEVDRLEVFPDAVTLSAGAEQQFVVRAHYTDGRYEDVTHWAKFGTTDESVANVDDWGKAIVKGPGACAITVWYSSKVSFANLMAPREKAVPAEVYANAENRNYIDEKILTQLASLQITPAAKASDSEFVRRAYLDALGILPSPEEASAFVADSSPTKRETLINSLLARPEYNDYWAYKWSDLLLLSSKKLTRRSELVSFYQYIHKSVEQNKPWDKFVSDIITAKGSSVENGAVNYYLIHKETVDLAETTSQAFLGMSVTCARCHNHPLEKWTQDDYYGYANLLSRVNLKNGPGGRDTRVTADTFGDIIHPRIGRPMPPKPLDGEAIPLDQEGDRRVALADWLTSPENPYFTRAIVNRVWKNFMGRGLVEPEDDLRLTNPPVNEALFAALEKDLIEHKYDLRHLMRTIMNSAAYQRKSVAADPEFEDNKYFSQYIVRRLSAEVLLDAYSQVTGVPTDFSGYPQGYRALQLPDSQVGSYFLTAFGRPVRVQTCSCERTDDTNVAQTLHVANGETLNGKLRSDNSVIAKLVKNGAQDNIAIETIYLRAFGRKPAEHEMKFAEEILATVEAGENAEQARREALEDLAWAVLSGKSFMFNY